MKTESFRLVVAVCVFFASTHAFAQDKSYVVPYPVDGRNAQEVYTYIKTKAPRVAANATFAFTMIGTKTRHKAKFDKAVCRYTQFSTAGLFAFNIPQHKNVKSLPGKTRKNWGAFTAYLKSHEEGHMRIWQKCFKDYDAEVLQLAAKDCKSLERERNGVFEAIKRKCLAEDEAYDVIFRKEVLTTPFMREAQSQQ
jgi:predicted secreted Zn-dependent protease